MVMMGAAGPACCACTDVECCPLLHTVQSDLLLFFKQYCPDPQQPSLKYAGHRLVPKDAKTKASAGTDWALVAELVPSHCLALLYACDGLPESFGVVGRSRLVCCIPIPWFYLRYFAGAAPACAVTGRPAR